MTLGGGRVAARQLWRQWRTSGSMATSCSLAPPLPSFSFSSVLLSSSSSSSGHRLRRYFTVSPTVLGLLGASTVGLWEWVHADADKGGEGPVGGIPTSSSSASGDLDPMENVVRTERQRLEELLKSRGIQRGMYPPFSLSAKGQKVTVKFRIPPTCEVSHLIVDLVSHLGLKAEQHGGGSDMLLRAWDSGVAWQITLNPLERNKETAGDSSADKEPYKGSLCILIFESLVSSENCEIEFIKEGTFSFVELDAVVNALKLAGEKSEKKKSLGQKSGRSTTEKQNNYQAEKKISSLESMGVRVYGVNGSYGTPDGSMSWENIAGYEQQKREIEDTILLALQRPEVYDEIARATRRKFETNRPRAVLFEGPPGTGKTSCARVIANQAGVPLLYVPLEVVMSKYYGESERLLGQIFSLANELPNGAIIFLDEIDSFAASRDSEMHEATRRILSVLLRQIDGFEEEKSVVLIAATNRKQDLDPALISRFDTMIPFPLPDKRNREEIAAQHAMHLKRSELAQLAEVTEGMSGRDIRDICQQAERYWASKLIRSHAASSTGSLQLPPIEEYIKSAEVRRKTLLEVSEGRNNRTSGSKSAEGRGLLLAAV